MADQPATQRHLLETNTELTRLVYETVGELTQKMNDGFADLRERLAHLEGRDAEETASTQEDSMLQSIRTSKWVRASIGLSYVVGVAGLFKSFHH